MLAYDKRHQTIYMYYAPAFLQNTGVTLVAINKEINIWM